MSILDDLSSAIRKVHEAAGPAVVGCGTRAEPVPERRRRAVEGRHADGAADVARRADLAIGPRVATRRERTAVADFARRRVSTARCNTCTSGCNPGER